MLAENFEKLGMSGFELKPDEDKTLLEGCSELSAREYREAVMDFNVRKSKFPKVIFDIMH